MSQISKMKYRIVKVVLVVVAIFLCIIAFNDFTPTQTSVEKTIAYEKK